MWKSLSRRPSWCSATLSRYRLWGRGDRLSTASRLRLLREALVRVWIGRSLVSRATGWRVLVMSTDGFCLAGDYRAARATAAACGRRSATVLRRRF